MDKYLAAAQAHLRLAQLALNARMDAIEKLPKGMSRRILRQQHTQTMLTLLEELDAVLGHDPDMWDDDPDSVPF